MIKWTVRFIRRYTVCTSPQPSTNLNMMCNSSLIAPIARKEPDFTETADLDSARSLALIKSLLNSQKYKHVLIYLCGGKDKYESHIVLHLFRCSCVLIGMNIFSKKPRKGYTLKCGDSLCFMPAWRSPAITIIPFDSILGTALHRSSWE